MSLRASVFRPSACSGLMYSGVPSTTPALVRAGSSARAERSLARPKSMSTARPVPVSMITLLLLTSRWVSPAEWIFWRAARVWPPMRRNSSTVSGPEVLMRPKRLCPAMNSIAK